MDSGTECTSTEDLQAAMEDLALTKEIEAEVKGRRRSTEIKDEEGRVIGVMKKEDTHLSTDQEESGTDEKHAGGGGENQPPDQE